MSLPDLSEVGPDGERWWAMVSLINEVPISYYSHNLLFTSLEDIVNRLARENHFAAKYHSKIRYQAFLADSRPLVTPFVGFAGCSVWQDPEDDIFPDDEDPF